jgi:hypothetical protein
MLCVLYCVYCAIQSNNSRAQSSALARSKPYDSEAALSDEESGDNIQQYKQHISNHNTKDNTPISSRRLDTTSSSINGQANQHSNNNTAGHHRSGSSNSGSGSGTPDRGNIHHHKQVSL